MVWEGVDMEIRYDPDHSTGLDATLLFEDSLYPVCSPEISKRLKSAGDLLGEYLIHVIGNRRGWNEWFRAAGLPSMSGCREIQTDTSGLALSMATKGAGVALGHQSLVGRLLQSGELVRPFDTELRTSGVFYLITPSERPLSAPAQQFKAWLVSEGKLP
jgi:LysR family glycine cleavage system transcriptional activator